MIGRQVISSQTDNIAAKFLPSSGSSGSSEGSASVTDAVSQMGSATLQFRLSNPSFFH